jgi:hypothetical protein
MKQTMSRSKQIQIDDIFAIVYYLNQTVEIHFVCEKLTYISAAQKLLKYLESEAFITTEPIKLICLPAITK